MVFCPIPTQISEEEKFLQQKYLKLKKKKKLLQQQKIPKPEIITTTIKTQLKRGIDGTSKQDAKEVAKKLIKSGAISAIKPPEKEKQGFKRSKNSQRKKLEQADKPKYQPFSAVYKADSYLDSSSFNSSSNDILKNIHEGNLPTKEKEALAREETFREKRRDGKAHYVNRDIPNVGNTIYVHGIGVNEQILRLGFSQFGNIIKIIKEFNKNCGFVTFETIDQANKAIDAMNGNQIQNITLKVSLARKQPFINKNQNSVNSNLDSLEANSNINASSTISTDLSTVGQSPVKSDWSSIAASFEQKVKTTKDKRSLIAYDDIY